MQTLAREPQALANAAERAQAVGRPHAASDLADLVERIAGGVAPIPVRPAAPMRVPPCGMGVPA